ncbi:MAG: hypothetical protein AAGG38_11095 [Planctomycetota bacterium]
MFDLDQLPVPDLGLSCPACAYPLAGLPQHVCPECGRAFTLEEFVPAGDMPTLYADGQAVLATQEIVTLFEAYQLPFLRLQNNFDAALGSYSRTILSQPAPPVGVPPGHYLEAIDLIRRLTQGEPMPEPPAPPHLDDGRDWICSACREPCPSNFGVCWNCDTPR